MPDVKSISGTKPGAHSGTPLSGQAISKIPVVALGMSLGLFLAVTFILHIASI